jgi:type IV pilus assembly protein PilE
MLKIRGFTLIEIMITVAIVAILAAVGYPNYTSYVQRGKLAEAVSGLSDLRVKLEQYYQDNRTYVGACAAGTTAPLPATTANFSFACDLAAATYTATAQGIGSMAAFKYTVNQTNTKATLSVPADWLGAGSACWVIKKDGSC